MLNNKRGQGLSTNAIILIILGVVILVMMIIGFTVGFSKLAPWLVSDTNVDDIATQCNIACSTNSQYAFCEQEMTLKIKGEPDSVETCEKLAVKYKAIANCPVFSPC